MKNPWSSCLGAETFIAGNGGIARVGRMCARALIEGGADAELISYRDRAHTQLAGRNVRICHGSKALFVALIRLSTITHNSVLYDSLGPARAHPHILWPRRPFAVWIHGLEVWEGLRNDYACVIRRADQVFVNSDFTLERYQEIHGLLPTARVCWLGTEQDAPPGARANFSGPPTVLIVGRLDATQGWKGHTELLDCWPEVVAAVPDARLVVAGGGTGLEAMRDAARTSPAASSIDVRGYVSEAEMPALFERAHVFAMPSRQEGFGIVYVEAMRYGLPVIASVHDAGREVNLDGETGFNVDLARRHELPERLIHLLGDVDVAASMGQAGFRRWQQHYTYSRFADRFLAHWRAGLAA
jgi:phosphatidyl-myo-inositol dimannoside synthase